SAGKAFLPHARTAVHSAERAIRSAREALQLETGELEISTVRSIAVGLLPDLIKAWRERFPRTFVRLHEFTHRRLAEDAVRHAVLTSQVEAAARLASAGVGPALVPENAIPRELAASVVRVDPPVGRELTVYARAEWTPLGGAFVELMRGSPWSDAPVDAAVIA